MCKPVYPQLVLTLGRGLLAVLLVALISSTCWAETDSAGLVLNNYLVLSQQLNWDGCAELIAEEDLQALKTGFMQVFDMVEAAGKDVTPLLAAFGNLDSYSELSSQDSKTFFAHFMRWIFDMVPAMGEMMRDAEAEILGYVPEGDTLRHFVNRTTVTDDEDEVSTTEVVSVRHYESGWFVTFRAKADKFISLSLRIAGSL